MRPALFVAALLSLISGVAAAGEARTRVLLIGKDRDHAFTTHEYLADCELLAKCLKQTPGVDTVVSNGWPKDPQTLKGVNALVLFTANGGDVLLAPAVRKQAETLLEQGAGLTAIHWSTGANKKNGDDWLTMLGGWFNTDFSRYLVRTTRVKQADPKHPICRGWKDFDLKDEYYIQLKHAPEARPVIVAEIDKKEHVLGWAFERTKTRGRSFGFVCGHFHANFGEPEFRRIIVNGILWTAHLDVPAAGAPVAITPKDMELPPDTRTKKK